MLPDKNKNHGNKRKTKRQGQQLNCISVYAAITTVFLIIAELVKGRDILFFGIHLFNGFLGWTYLEYHLHRFWTHNNKNNSASFAYQSHMHHHQHPTEIKVTLLPRILLLTASGVFFALAVWWNNYFTLLTGFFIGFSYSFFSHWILHQKWSRKILPRLHRFHICHHCKYPDRCFGFSCPWWDIVFSTTPPREAVISNKVIRFYYGGDKNVFTDINPFNH